MDIFFAFLILLTTIENCYGDQGKWAYTGELGQDKWSELFQACGGKNQSPIDIQTKSANLKYYVSFVFNNYYNNLQKAILKNNGHTVQIDADSEDKTISISGGGLKNGYIFKQAHFHWGSSDSCGSEHAFDHKKYPLELHLVHYSEKIEKFEDAAKTKDGLAVLGILFEICGEDNPNFNTLLSYFKDVIIEHSKFNITGISLAKFLPENRDYFYRYSGSLTTPECQETVIWTIFQETIKISRSQLSKFRFLEENSHQKIVDNFRFLQPLNNRVVSASFSTSSGHQQNTVTGKTMRRKHKSRLNSAKQNEIEPWVKPYSHRKINPYS